MAQSQKGARAVVWSVDGDGALHAVGHDVNDPNWRIQIRCAHKHVPAGVRCAPRLQHARILKIPPATLRRLRVSCRRRYQLKQVRRKNTQTSFTANLYWTGGGEALSESQKEEWKAWLKDSLQLLKDVLPEPLPKK